MKDVHGMTGILIPDGGDPRRVTLETDEHGLMGDALSRLVGGCFDTLPIVIPGVDLWVNDDGASQYGPNRAIYATRAMEEHGYLSQIDYRHVPAEGELYTILHGPIVALGFDPDSGESVSLTDEQAGKVAEYFTGTSPAGSGLLENLKLRLGIPPFADDPTDAADPTNIAASEGVALPYGKGL
ncbi:DUF3846 domain-containing protein [Bifidobacterium adolescentis]|uniref:DUF3846 domain-containing protein n=1 Tax=Bifidobacterium adolescentis TaxID=1680 RepID=UPI0040640CAE